MEALHIIRRARVRAVDVNLEHAIVLANAGDGVLGAVIDLDLTGGANAVDIDVGHAVLIDAELVCALLLHQRAMTRGVHV